MIYLLQFRFNRDIVECKDDVYVVWSCKTLDLIETLWNVKKGQASHEGTSPDGFNRDIVECKA